MTLVPIKYLHGYIPSNFYNDKQNVSMSILHVFVRRNGCRLVVCRLIYKGVQDIRFRLENHNSGQNKNELVKLLFAWNHELDVTLHTVRFYD